MSVPVRRGRVGPQVNKFEQFTSNDRQILVAWGTPGLMPKGWSDVQGVPYHVTYAVMHVMFLPPTPNRMTDAYENIVFPQLHWRAVMKFVPVFILSPKNYSYHQFSRL